MRRPQHAPPELEKYLNTTHAGLVQWAGRLGPSVALVAQEMFADRAVDGMRPVRALIRLADTYTTGRLEAVLSPCDALRHARLQERQEHPGP